MARALATHGLHFPSEQRADVLAALRNRKAALNRHDCNYWVFEDVNLPGVLLEFYEAPSRETLLLARDAAGVAAPGQPILSEVELS